MRQLTIAIALGFLMTAGQPAWSQSGSGFLSDYSKLKAASDNMLADQVYVAPGALESLSKYSAVMVDQPEIFISPDSKYKGAKPDIIKQLADLMRAGISERLDAGENFTVVQTPGPGVLFLRVGLTDVHIKKKSRGIFGYTPIGFVVTTTARAAAKELEKKIEVVQMNTEIEILDSQSGEVLGAAVFQRGHVKDKAKHQKRDLVTWDEFEAYMNGVGARVNCRMNNSRLPESQWEDCAAIPVEVPEK